MRALAMQLMTDKRHKDAVNAKLTHEIAVLKRWKFAATSEKLPPKQAILLDEAIDADLIAIEHELASLIPPTKTLEQASQPRCASLPAKLPRTVLHHEPESTLCACGCQLKRIGEDVSEKLDYTPGVFTVERHIRGQ
jgi:transposase